MIELDKKQKIMHDTMVDWYNSHKSDYIVCSGYAGTGKTTILGEVLKTFGKQDIRVSCATFTGKASHVLIKKIKHCPYKYCGTIHGLIYSPTIDPITGELLGFKRNSPEDVETDLIIIDECSMIDEDLFNDLLSFHIPIIFIGDNAQLPPVSSKRFDIFSNIDCQLTQIHRQAEKSMIIKLSMMVRNNEVIHQGHGGDCSRIDWYDDHKEARAVIYNHNPKSDEILLCGMNKTRIRLNNIIRKNLKIPDNNPIIGDKIVCLQNNHELGIMNGQLGFIKDMRPFTKYAYDMDLIFDGKETNHCVFAHGFNQINQNKYWKQVRTKGLKETLNRYNYSKLDSVDYGYALSVHKSQGAQWDSVILINERNSYQSNKDYRKWLYTGITRAERKLTIIDNF